MFSAKSSVVVAVILVQLVAHIQGGSYSTEDKWVYLDKTMDLPEGAVRGGIDADGYYNYVGRVAYSSNILPARVVPELGKASYNTDTFGGQATTYEVLVANATVSYHWIRSFDGFLEKNAVSVGTNSVSDRVFICRVRCDGGLFIGTLYPPKRMCIVKHENLAFRQFDKYETLTRERHVIEYVPYHV